MTGLVPDGPADNKTASPARTKEPNSSVFVPAKEEAAVVAPPSPKPEQPVLMPPRPLEQQQQRHLVVTQVLQQPTPDNYETDCADEVGWATGSNSGAAAAEVQQQTSVSARNGNIAQVPCWTILPHGESR